MMPSHEHFQLTLYPDLIHTIHTDADAEPWLPPSPLFRDAYVSLRDAGMTPRDALTETTSVWREMQASARPAGYGKSKME